MLPSDATSRIIRSHGAKSPLELRGTQRPTRESFLFAGDHIAFRSTERGEMLVLRECPETGRFGGMRLVLTTAVQDDLSNEMGAWQVMISGTPSVPAWTFVRPYLVGTFLLAPQRAMQPQRLIDEVFRATQASALRFQRLCGWPMRQVLQSLPVVVQEKVLLADLLSTFLGFEGKHVRMMQQQHEITGMDRQGGATEVSSVRFELDTSTFDRSLASLCEKMLPIGGAYLAVKGFVVHKLARHEHGMVCGFDSSFPFFRCVSYYVCFLCLVSVS